MPTLARAIGAKVRRSKDFILRLPHMRTALSAAIADARYILESPDAPEHAAIIEQASGATPMTLDGELPPSPSPSSRTPPDAKPKGKGKAKGKKAAKAKPQPREKK